MFDQHLAEDIGPGVVIRYPDPPAGRRRKAGAIANVAVHGGQQIDAGKAFESLRHRQEFRLGKGIGELAAKAELPDAGGLCRMRHDHDAVGHHRVIGIAGAVPFQHGEFRQMQIAALAVPEYPRQLENLRLACRQQLLAGKFRRGPQVASDPLAVATRQFGAGRVQMGLIARRHLQDSGLDLDKTLLIEPCPHSAGDGATRRQKRPDVGVARRRPPWRKWATGFAHRISIHRGRLCCRVIRSRRSEPLEPFS